MDRRINPFNEIYVTETTPAASFVKVFSPTLLCSAEPLFLPGNVVLKGVQGSGKSMLLNLLKPEIRLAYEREGQRFPLQGRFGRFISAGVNLTRSGAIDFGQRSLTGSSTRDLSELPLFFADFLNYFLVYDILQTLDAFRTECDGKVAHDLNLQLDDATLNQFAVVLGSSRCWFGYLTNVHTYPQLRLAIANRIDEYLRYLSFNSDAVSREIQLSKTAVGEPLAQTSEVLRQTGVLPTDVHLFIRIDQYEELCRLETLQSDGHGPTYRAVVNKALGLRNPLVSYRVGTRGYAWDDMLAMYGTTARLERDRNYKLIDLDELLRRKENRRTWLFPSFAEDVFARRLAAAGFSVGELDNSVSHVFGTGMSPEQRAVRYCGTSPDKSVRLDDTWPEPWKLYLKQLALTDPLSARLADGWARQRGKTQIVNQDPPRPPFPWDQPAKQYWRKERIQQSLMQIAGRCRQRMIWGGKDDILELSGGNILVFVSICQHVWSAWLRSVRQTRDIGPKPPVVSDAVQAVGIHEASIHWFNKLAEETDGNRRQRFISYVGSTLEKKMYSDLSLSYPGHNGFSLMLAELDASPDVKRFLNDAVDYGALFDAPHTTKEKNRRPRRKFYLNPVLSPFFRIPHIHTKEPRYVSAAEVRNWIVAADEGTARGPSRESADSHASCQGSLFD